MTGEFIEALAEITVHVGTKLINTAMEPSREINKKGLAYVILESSIEQAAIIVKNMGGARILRNEDEFGFIVGVISAEQSGLVQLLTGVSVSVLTECPEEDIERLCGRAVAALRR